MCARAVGANIESDVRPILDQMFSLGLSQELTNSLKVLANEIPALLKEIQGIERERERGKRRERGRGGGRERERGRKGGRG